MQNKTQPKSNQDAFNRVYKHFITEKNPRCLGPEGKCANRNPEHTNGCAIGCMLPERLWSAEGDDLSFISLMEEAKGVADWFSKVDATLLCDLQTLHDEGLLTVEEFKRVAVKFSLHCL